MTTLLLAQMAADPHYASLVDQARQSLSDTAGIPGLPLIMGKFITDAFNSLTGVTQSQQAEKQLKQSKKMTDAQLEAYKMQFPFLKGLSEESVKLIFPALEDALTSYESAKTFDPAKETEMAMGAYDAAARESLSTDIGTVNTGYTGRGFNSGNSSSDQTGANEDVLARRAAQRGQLASSLRMRETDRRDEVTGRASDKVARAFQLLDPSGRTSGAIGSLQGPVNSSLNMANYYQNQANSAAGNAGPIVNMGINALSGIKWPWQKSGGGGGGGGSDAAVSPGTTGAPIMKYLPFLGL